MTEAEALKILESAGFNPQDMQKMKEANDLAAAENFEKQIEEASIFFDAFSTVAGSEVLEVLKDRTTRLSVMNKSLCIEDGDIPLNPGEFMAYREGQNALIRFIVKQMKLATTQKEGE